MRNDGWYLYSYTEEALYDFLSANRVSTFASRLAKKARVRGLGLDTSSMYVCFGAGRGYQLAGFLDIQYLPSHKQVSCHAFKPHGDRQQSGRLQEDRLSGQFGPLCDTVMAATMPTFRI